MNERIRELAKQCYETGPIGRDGWPEYSRYSRLNETKFAELLIQKCADIGEQYADGNYEVRNQILEYFGLEEQ